MSKMEGKTDFSRRLKQFAGFVTVNLLIIERFEISVYYYYYGRTLSVASMLYFAAVFFHLFLWPP